MEIYEDHIELFWDDLTPEAQDTIENLLGDNGNYDTFPFASIVISPDEEEKTTHRTAEKAQKQLEALGRMQATGKAQGFPCPRCGRDRMDESPLRNALSRHAMVYICNVCGMEEAILAMQRLTPMLLEQWAIFEKTTLDEE